MVGSRIVAQGVLKIVGTGVGMALFLDLAQCRSYGFCFRIGHCADELFVGIGKGRTSRIELASGATPKASQKQRKR